MRCWTLPRRDSYSAGGLCRNDLLARATRLSRLVYKSLLPIRRIEHLGKNDLKRVASTSIAGRNA